MKAYVIKNKEGKYKRPDDSIQLETYFHNTLSSAEIFDDYETALCDCPSNCEVVEITIAEGDLEKENRILKRALEMACEKLADVFGECPYSNMNLPMPEYCDEECINNEKYLCWDKYFIEQAKGEKDE